FAADRPQPALPAGRCERFPERRAEFRQRRARRLRRRRAERQQERRAQTRESDPLHAHPPLGEARPADRAGSVNDRIRPVGPTVNPPCGIGLPPVEFGLACFATHDGVQPGALARLAEERGHESLFFPEHTHIPASRATPYPAGGELPRKYSHTYDLFVALACAAEATSHLRIGS